MQNMFVSKNFFSQSGKVRRCRHVGHTQKVRRSCYVGHMNLPHAKQCSYQFKYLIFQVSYHTELLTII